MEGGACRSMESNSRKTPLRKIGNTESGEAEHEHKEGQSQIRARGGGCDSEKARGREIVAL